jgi:DNA-directed RNA polymerase subunit RPC12/RpoP
VQESSIKCADCESEIASNIDINGEKIPCSECGSILRRYYSMPNSMQMTNYTLDNFIAYKLSELTKCEAPNLSDDSTWLNSFILNSIFRVKLPSDKRAYVFNFLRRTEGASFAYRSAILEINEYLNTPENTISPYFKALSQIEVCISQCYQGYELLSRASGEPIYASGDGSSEERLQIVYVDSKHMDRMIHGGKLPESATSGIWITNNGIESARGKLSFQELHDILIHMHTLAENLASLGAK